MESKKNKFYVMRDHVLINGLLDLVYYIDGFSSTKDMSMIEIGSYLGDSTLVFAQHFKSVIAIDPFINDYDPNDDTCNYAPLDLVFDEFSKRIKDVKNIEHIRETSDIAIGHFEQGKYIDFVYIDGMHTYVQVKKDIQSYLPLIKDGGFIGGHDYAENKKEVMDAVNEAFGKPDIVFHDTSWLKRV